MPAVSRIGIAMAVYQPEPGAFAEQLASVLAQEWKDWVCILSFDSDPEAVRGEARVRELLADSRFRVSRNDARLGFKKNFERAIQLALREGVDAIALSDQDDVWYPRKLAVLARALRSAPALSLAHSDMHVRADGLVLPETAWKLEHRGVSRVAPEELLIRNVVSGASLLMDAGLARKYPSIPDSAPFHDQWYALAAAHHGGIVAVPEALYEYRQHRANVVGVIGFEGLFSLRAGNSLGSVLSKSRRGWRESRDLARAAIAAGMPLSDRARRMFLETGDAGLGMLLTGARTLRADPPLARAALIRGTGKLLSWLTERS